MDSRRSKSTSGVNWQIEVYGSREAAPPPSGLDDFRNYSTYSYSGYASKGVKEAGPPPSGLDDYRSYSTYSYSGYGSKGVKEKVVSSTSAASSSSSKKSGWALSDPDFQRRKRVASYKAYAVEGRMKGSWRRSFRWLKDRYNKMLYGWW